ncbi:hypothetical protein BK640_26590 [Pseudomonas protegens]|nr:hypothetical protein BK639_18955 [Pseudomonas protegens]ROL96357.1 hypothetical protein BK640_26590 [Pseudomonas protegens]ROL98234.1 hypothetical protein BK641_28990 [Pseudomonas protegens]ROM08021.1 hypothetical protein BK642_15890 [Pseudomonas protegens]
MIARFQCFCWLIQRASCMAWVASCPRLKSVCLYQWGTFFLRIGQVSNGISNRLPRMGERCRIDLLQRCKFFFHFCWAFRSMTLCHLMLIPVLTCYPLLTQ